MCQSSLALSVRQQHCCSAHGLLCWLDCWLVTSYLFIWWCRWLCSKKTLSKSGVTVKRLVQRWNISTQSSVKPTSNWQRRRRKYVISTDCYFCCLSDAGIMHTSKPSVTEQECYSRTSLPVRCWDNAYLKTFCYRTGMLQQNIAVPPDLLTNNCNVHKCTHWARINDWYESIVTSLYVTIDDQSQQ